jgi:hypothetical protein
VRPLKSSFQRSAISFQPVSPERDAPTRRSAIGESQALTLFGRSPSLLNLMLRFLALAFLTASISNSNVGKMRRGRS